MVRTPGTTPDKPNPHPDTVHQAQEFIAQIQCKIDRLLQDFADGQVTRAQFQRLYDRYQRQIGTVQQLLASAEHKSWREAIFETEDTLKLKKRFTAKPLGMRLYGIQNGQRIHTLGEFPIDDQLIAPLLHSCRATLPDSFRAGTRSAELENGQWLCFMPGRHTVLMALFSLQPSGDQLETLEHMHEDFEEVNLAALQSSRPEAEDLVYPFYALMQHRDPHYFSDQDS
ncbi:hypothetical protein [Aggregatilinea lenta]|uniref:hypothetical protein n=1 Tax=Aggregatilinea lenta TaxID=913108 RepID=UPI000E5A21BE|nr:hypothetical protein [Aggregatilinea lenta]